MCYDDNARPPLPPGAAGPASGADLEVTAADGNRYMAYRAMPTAAPRALILVLPDVRGLHQFYKELALRFAESGIGALAIDYFGRSAETSDRDERFEFWPHVYKMTFDSFMIDAAAALAHLRAQAPAELGVYTLGFCMGGGLSFQCACENLGLAGAVGFYAGLTRGITGTMPMLERSREVQVPILALFGGDDPHIPADQIATFTDNVSAAGVAHEVITYPGAPHSFFDRRASDFAAESADAWKRVLAFIGA